MQRMNLTAFRHGRWHTLATALLATAACAEPRTEIRSGTAIEHVAIVDVVQGRTMPDMTGDPVGTDTPNPFVYPRVSLHDELGLFVQAGLSPAQALRAAVYEPAVFLGATDSLGTVEPGKLADLVLLDGDPLQDIANTGKIDAVFANGRLFNRAALDELLAKALRGGT